MLDNFISIYEVFQMCVIDEKLKDLIVGVKKAKNCYRTWVLQTTIKSKMQCVF